MKRLLPHLFWIVPSLWLVGVFYSPHTDATPQDAERGSEARGLIEAQVAVRFPNPEGIIVKQRGRFILEIWLSRASFESVAYPARKEFLDAVGKTYCDHVTRDLLPAIVFRDTRSGETLATYHCLFSYSVINSN